MVRYYFFQNFPFSAMTPTDAADSQSFAAALVFTVTRPFFPAVPIAQLLIARVNANSEKCWPDELEVDTVGVRMAHVKEKFAQ